MAGWALLPLRAFLGITFTYAALIKLANPTFFSSASPSGIQAQLLASDRTSPLHPLLEHLIRFAGPIGLLIALAELAVGLGTLLGLFTRVAALGGALLSLTLFLTVSFHTSPYFTGADIVFLFAWTPLVIAGSGGVLSLDALAAARARALVQRDSVRSPALRRDRREIDRRTFALQAAAAGVVAAAGLVLAGVTAGLGRLVGGAKVQSSGTTTLSADAKHPGSSTTTTAPPATGSPSTTAPAAGGSPTTTTTPSSTTTTAPAPAGNRLGPASTVPVGGAATFTDPATSGPGLVLRPSSDHFVAFSAVCPHAGCTVRYQSGAHLIACPCHGSQFDPTTGAVIQGPATRGLTKIPVTEGTTGDLYVDG